MITKVEKLTSVQLEHIRQTVGEAFVSNELFHNWGTGKICKGKSSYGGYSPSV